MKVTCPKCHLKGMVDTGPLMLQTRVLCVRCATSYEAVLVDGDAETLPASSNGHTQAWEAVDWNSDASSLELMPDEPLELPGPVLMERALMQGEHVLEDLLGEVAFVQDSSRAETIIAPIQAEQAEDESLSLAEAVEPLSMEATPWPYKETAWPDEETASASEEEAASVWLSEEHEALPSLDVAPRVEEESVEEDVDERSATISSASLNSSSTFEALVLPASVSEADRQDSLLDVTPQAAESAVLMDGQPVGYVHTSKDVLPYHDKYSLGVRLMRVSPVWLLGSGLLFISLIFVFNWATKPNAQANNLTLEHSLTNIASNQATHQTDQNLATNASVAPSTNNAPPSTKAAPTYTPAQEVSNNSPAANTDTTMNPTPATKPAPATKAATESSPAQSDNPAGGNFTVQVGSYSDGTQAQERAVSLKAAGFDARVVEAQLSGRGTWYRVQTGRFGTREEAARYSQQLRAQRMAAESIITETQNR
jgi:cell division protein FtsN